MGGDGGGGVTELGGDGAKGRERGREPGPGAGRVSAGVPADPEAASRIRTRLSCSRVEVAGKYRV